MESNTAEKLKIRSVVSRWEMEHPTEYSAFVDGQKVKTENLADKFAELPGDGFIMRLLYEVPETLDAALNRSLEDGEKDFLKSLSGAQWFAKTFKQYNVSQKT